MVVAPRGPVAPPADAAAARAAAAHAAILHAAAEAKSGPGTPGYGRSSFWRGFVYAWHGLVYAVRTQRNARVHMALAVLAIAVGVWLRISPVEFALIFVAITGVFIAEMFNTVAEACVDLITDQYHPLARIAKDVAAGAVLLNAMLSVVIGLFVFVPHLWRQIVLPYVWPAVHHWLLR
jgi:diacylglycerol kinase